jgi:hypothetical protein
VMLGPDEPKDQLRMAKLLSECAGLSQPEALALLEPGPGGLLARGLSSEVADKLCKVLIALGQQARVLRDAQLPQPTFGGEVVALEVAEHGITLETRNAAPTIVPREDVVLLSVGLLNPESKPANDGSIQASRGRLLAHLYVGGEQALQRYVLDARTLNYSALGELKRDSSTVNFGVLLRKLVEGFPEMATNRSVHLLLADLRSLVYKNESEMIADGTSRMLSWPQGTPSL